MWAGPVTIAPQGVRLSGNTPLLADVLPREHWWRLYLDPKHHVEALTSFPADPGSYYDNDQSPGFQQGMVEAYEHFLNDSSVNSETLNSATYKQMHETITQHLGVQLDWTGRTTRGNVAISTSFPVRNAEVSPDVFADRIGNRPLMMDFHHALNQRGANPVTFTSTLVGRNGISGNDMPRTITTNYARADAPVLVDQIFNQYRSGLVAAGNDRDAKLAVIARTVRTLHITHPFEDGNRRLNVHVLLPKLLLDNGFQPVVAPDMDELFQGGRSIDNVVDILRGSQLGEVRLGGDVRPRAVDAITQGPDGTWLADGRPLEIRSLPGARPSLALLNEYDFRELGNRVLLPDGAFTAVVVHGAGDVVHAPVRNRDGSTGTVALTPGQLATVVQNPGTPIALLSCDTGALAGGFAHQFADAHRGDVLAPTSAIIAGGLTAPSGVRTVGDQSWQLYGPDAIDNLGWDVVNDVEPFDGISATPDASGQGLQLTGRTEEPKPGGNVTEKSNRIGNTTTSNLTDAHATRSAEQHTPPAPSQTVRGGRAFSPSLDVILEQDETSPTQQPVLVVTSPSPQPPAPTPPMSDPTLQQQMGFYTSNPNLVYEVDGAYDTDALVDGIRSAAIAQVRARLPEFQARVTPAGRGAVRIDTAEIDRALRENLQSFFTTGGRTFEVRAARFGLHSWHNVTITPNRQLVPAAGGDPAETFVGQDADKAKYDTRTDASTTVRDNHGTIGGVSLGIGGTAGGRLGPGGGGALEASVARSGGSVEQGSTTFDSHNVRSGGLSHLMRSPVTFDVVAHRTGTQRPVPGLTPTIVRADIGYRLVKDIIDASPASAPRHDGPFDTALLAENTSPVRILDARMDGRAAQPWNDVAERVIGQLGRTTGVVIPGSPASAQVRELLSESSVLGMLTPALENPGHSPLMISPSRRQALGLDVSAEVVGIQPIADIDKSSFRWQPGLTETSREQKESTVGAGVSVTPIRWGFGPAFLQARGSAAFRRASTATVQQDATTRLGTEFKDIPNSLAQITVRVRIDPALQLNTLRHPRRRHSQPIELDLTVLARLPQDRLAQILSPPADSVAIGNTAHLVPQGETTTLAPPFLKYGGRAVPLGMTRFAPVQQQTTTLIKQIGGGFLPAGRTAGVSGRMWRSASATERARNQAELDRVLSVGALRQNYHGLLNGGTTAVLKRVGPRGDRYAVVHVSAIHPSDPVYAGTESKVGVRAFQAGTSQDGSAARAEWRGTAAVEAGFIQGFPSTALSSSLTPGLGVEGQVRVGRQGGVDISGQKASLQGGTVDSARYAGPLQLKVEVFSYSIGIGRDPRSRVRLGRRAKPSGRAVTSGDFTRVPSALLVDGRVIDRYDLTDQQPVTLLYSGSAVPTQAAADLTPRLDDAEQSFDKHLPDLTALRRYVNVQPAADPTQDRTVTSWQSVESMPGAAHIANLARQAARDTQRYSYSDKSRRHLGGLRGDSALVRGMPLWARIGNSLSVNRQTAAMSAMTEGQWHLNPLTIGADGGELNMAITARITNPRLISARAEIVTELAPGGGIAVWSTKSRERNTLARANLSLGLRKATVKDTIGGVGSGALSYQRILTSKLVGDRHRVGGFIERNNRNGKSRTYLVVADMRVSVAAQVDNAAKFPKSLLPNQMQPESWARHKAAQRDGVVRNAVYLRVTEEQAIQLGVVPEPMPQARPIAASTARDGRAAGLRLASGRSPGQGLQVLRDVPSLIQPAITALTSAAPGHPVLQPILDALNGRGLADPMLNRRRMLALLSSDGVQRSWASLFDGGVSLIHTETDLFTQRLYDVRLEATTPKDAQFQSFIADNDDIDVRTIGTTSTSNSIRTGHGGQLSAGGGGSAVFDPAGRRIAAGASHGFSYSRMNSTTSATETEHRTVGLSSGRGVKARMRISPLFEIKVYHRGRAVPEGTVTFTVPVTVDRWAGDLRLGAGREPARLAGQGAYRPTSPIGPEPGWQSIDGLLIPAHFAPEYLGNAVAMQTAVSRLLGGAAKRLATVGYPAANQIRAGLSPQVLLPHTAAMLSPGGLQLPAVQATDAAMHDAQLTVRLRPLAARLAGIDSKVFREHSTQSVTTAGTVSASQRWASSISRIQVGQAYVGQPSHLLDSGGGPNTGDSSSQGVIDRANSSESAITKPESASALLEYVVRPEVSARLSGAFGRNRKPIVTLDDGTTARVLVRMSLDDARRVLGIDSGAPPVARAQFDAVEAAETALDSLATAFIDTAEAEASQRYADPRTLPAPALLNERDLAESHWWSAARARYQALDDYQATWVAVGTEPDLGRYDPQPHHGPTDVDLFEDIATDRGIPEAESFRDTVVDAADGTVAEGQRSPEPGQADSGGWTARPAHTAPSMVDRRLKKLPRSVLHTVGKAFTPPADVSIDFPKRLRRWNQMRGFDRARPTRAPLNNAARNVTLTVGSKRPSAEASVLPNPSRATLRDKYGMPQTSVERFQSFAKKHNLAIYVRPTNPSGLQWSDGLAGPKPQSVKAKTINLLDVRLGASNHTIGLVALMRPEGAPHHGLADTIVLRMPADAAPAERAALEARLQQRAAEFDRLAPKIAELVRLNQMGIHHGVLGLPGTDNVFVPITGDHDLFDVRRAEPGGKMVEAELDAPSYQAVVDLMVAEDMGVMHGAHMRWNRDDPDLPANFTDAADADMFQHIVTGHQLLGGEPLIRFAPDEPVSLVWAPGNIELGEITSQVRPNTPLDIASNGSLVPPNAVRTVSLRDRNGAVVGVGLPSRIGDEATMTRFAAAAGPGDLNVYRSFADTPVGTHIDQISPWRGAARQPFYIDVHGDQRGFTVGLNSGEAIRVTGTQLAALTAQATAMHEAAAPSPAAPVLLLSCDTGQIAGPGGAAYDFHAGLQRIRDGNVQTYAATDRLYTNPDVGGRARIGVGHGGRIVAFGPVPEATAPLGSAVPLEVPAHESAVLPDVSRPAATLAPASPQLPGASQHSEQAGWTARPAQAAPSMASRSLTNQTDTLSDLGDDEISDDENEPADPPVHVPFDDALIGPLPARAHALMRPDTAQWPGPAPAPMLDPRLNQASAVTLDYLDKLTGVAFPTAGYSARLAQATVTLLEGDSRPEYLRETPDGPSQLVRKPWSGKPPFFYVVADADSQAFTVDAGHHGTLTVPGEQLLALTMQAGALTGMRAGNRTPVLFVSANAGRIPTIGGAAYDFMAALWRMGHHGEGYAATRAVGLARKSTRRLAVSDAGTLVRIEPRPTLTPSLPPVGRENLQLSNVRHTTVRQDGRVMVAFPRTISQNDSAAWAAGLAATTYQRYSGPSGEGAPSVDPAPWWNSSDSPLAIGAVDAGVGHVLVSVRGRGPIRIDGATLGRLVAEAGVLDASGQPAAVVLWPSFSGARLEPGGLAYDFAEQLVREHGFRGTVHAPDSQVLLGSAGATIEHGGDFHEVVARLPETSRPKQVKPRVRPVLDPRGRAIGVVLMADPDHLSRIQGFADNLGDGGLDLVETIGPSARASRRHTPWGGNRPRPGGRPLMIFVEREPGGDNFVLAGSDGRTIVVAPYNLPSILHANADFRRIDDSAFNRPLVLFIPAVRTGTDQHAAWIARAAGQFLDGQIAVGGYRPVYRAMSGIYVADDGNWSLLRTDGAEFELVREPTLDDIVVTTLDGGRGVALPLADDSVDVVGQMVPAGSLRALGANFVVAAAGNGTEIWAQTTNGGRKLVLDGTTLGRIAAAHPVIRQVLDGPATVGIVLASPGAGSRNDMGRTGYDFAVGLGVDTSTRPVYATPGVSLEHLNDAVRVATTRSDEVRSVVLKSSSGQPHEVGVVFPTARRFSPLDAADVHAWADNTTRSTMRHFTDSAGQVLLTETPWAAGSALPVVVVLGSDDGRTFSVRGEHADRALTLPVNELARVFAASAAFRSVAGAYHNKPIFVMLPSAFSAARATRAVQSLSAGLRRRGYFRTVHAAVGSEMLPTGQFTVPTWQTTVTPGPLMPRHVAMHPLFYRDGRLAGVHFPSKIGDQAEMTQNLYNSDVGGPLTYIIGMDPAAGGRVTRELRAADERWDALVVAHGSTEAIGIQMVRGGDQFLVAGDKLVDLMRAAGCLAAFSPVRYRGFTGIICLVGTHPWPDGPMSAFARRLQALGDDRPVRAASGVVAIAPNGSLVVDVGGAYHRYPPNVQVPPPVAPAPDPTSDSLLAPTTNPDAVRHVVVRHQDTIIGMGFPVGPNGAQQTKQYITDVDGNHDSYARYDSRGNGATRTSTPWGGSSGISPVRAFWIDASATSTTFSLQSSSNQEKIVLDGTSMADLIMMSGALDDSRSGWKSVIVLLGSSTAKQPEPGGSGHDLLVRLRQWGFTGDLYGATGPFHADPSAGSWLVGGYRRFGIDGGRFKQIEPS